ncbi:hypothetical protein QI633_25150 [Nocardioides sp. QY071]|uniref:hypothetical protein n=1 Tax=Nocardioides sp. QY071 TaxID=3044187 RepID=UPI00249C673F|nr:hypothetical protein [Nocardioides sp. QY071]WGY01809.1 hypothetical protein QI633_25150 [Nocardioides sp. QY071]
MDDLELDLLAQSHTDLFVDEIRQQCRYASFAAADLNAAWEISDSVERDERLFFAAQSLLSAAAMVSKLLWPVARSGARGRARGEKLRTTLQITASPLVQSRSVRDSFEHFDERMDAVLAKSHQHPYVDQIVGPTDMLRFEVDTAVPNFLRRLDTDKGTVSVLNATVRINDLVDELLEIKRACDKWLNGELPGRILPISRTVIRMGERCTDR